MPLSRLKSRFLTNPIVFGLLSMLPALSMMGCEESISTVGIPDFADTIISRRDTSFSAISRQQVQHRKVKGDLYNLTSRATKLIVGRRSDVESWGVIGFSKIVSPSDTLRLVLHWDTSLFKPASSQFRYYILPKLLTDSSSIVLSELSGGAGFKLDSASTTISLTGAELNFAKASDFTIVITGETVGDGFAGIYSMESTPAATAADDVRPYILGDSIAGVPKHFMPSADFYQASTTYAPSAGSMTVLGGLADRVKIDIALDSIKGDELHSGFVTINSALLRLVVDRQNTFIQGDSTIALFSVPLSGDVDSAEFIGYAKATNDTVEYELRLLVEQWLRKGERNKLEIRAGAITRSFFDKLIPVEDDNVERWSFYSPQETDPNRRPRLTITYSQVK